MLSLSFCFNLSWQAENKVLLDARLAGRWEASQRGQKHHIQSGYCIHCQQVSTEVNCNCYFDGGPSDRYSRLAFQKVSVNQLVAQPWFCPDVHMEIDFIFSLGKWGEVLGHFLLGPFVWGKDLQPNPNTLNSKRRACSTLQGTFSLLRPSCSKETLVPLPKESLSWTTGSTYLWHTFNWIHIGESWPRRG